MGVGIHWIGRSVADAGRWREPRPWLRRFVNLDRVILLQSDPTGLSSPIGTVAVVAGLLAAITVGVRHLWLNRKR